MAAVNKARGPARWSPFAAVMVTVVLALTGCSQTPGGGQDNMSMEEAATQLQARPDIEQTMTKYNQLMTDLKTALTDAGITGAWTEIHAAGEAACSDYGDEGANELNAENRSTPSWSSTGIPETDWPRALEILKRVTRAAGFTTIEVPHDEPGSHDLFIQGPYGAVLDFGTRVYTVMSIRSGCHRLPGLPINRETPETGPQST
jgi:hypothetical protein